ncbi:biotin--[acetyl-CoA-carboxylase] ligase [Polaribacter sp. R77954]|uniref:biotin--[acetyl-CoA-carboxylase] ligase n=1 Tax=Polaribacter sp. R77954 TaxID=3093870 RepID=UPI0037C66513
MKIIKLNAIDSTSSFLKELSKNSKIENYTVVTANEQTKGRGQQTNTWVSEPNKNLTLSVFIADLKLKISDQKYLNFAVSLAVFDLLSNLKINGLRIKWPNDIMSVNQKICGILIENAIRNNQIQSSIIGIGLNVNQVVFPTFLKHASSLKLLTNKDYNLEVLLEDLLGCLKKRIALLHNNAYLPLETNYLNVLYKKNSPTMFKDSQAHLFMGKIIGISSLGNLLIELENETVKEFGIKEVSLA